ncbi:hypothetical protein GXW82_09000 [Streptacidiphilus sp. 4-A2]|nr:hypothetical protein [Streptacidiphilus sp. 4-A2]
MQLTDVVFLRPLVETRARLEVSWEPEESTDGQWRFTVASVPAGAGKPGGRFM